MAATSRVSIDEEQALPLTADWMAVGYLGRSGQGVAGFQNGIAPLSVQPGGHQLTDVPVDMSYLVGRLGRTPAGFEMPHEGLTVTSFGAAGGIPGEVSTVQQPQPRSYSKPPVVRTGPWTEEEDRKLRDKVREYGEQKWSAIAEFLEGRAGKQCRERWINHLRPDIKQNDLWREEDDKMLIEAHRYYGNRWSLIAKHLPGRSENAIKNHWNATFRSLFAKRRLKKKKSEQVPPGRLSILEEYIRSVQPDDAVPAAPFPPSAPTLNIAYNSLLNPAMHAPEDGSVLTHAAMSLNATNSEAGSSTQGRINLNMTPLVPDLNISDPMEYYVNYPMYAPAPHLQLATEAPQQDYSSLNLSPYADYFALLRSEIGRYSSGASSSNPGTGGYYREAGRGSGGPAGDTDDTVELASWEFLTPSKDQVTLDLTRFK